jgi:hypothetical protein
LFNISLFSFQQYPDNNGVKQGVTAAVEDLAEKLAQKYSL